MRPFTTSNHYLKDLTKTAGLTCFDFFIPTCVLPFFIQAYIRVYYIFVQNKKVRQDSKDVSLRPRTNVSNNLLFFITWALLKDFFFFLLI